MTLFLQGHQPRYRDNTFVIEWFTGINYIILHHRKFSFTATWGLYYHITMLSWIYTKIKSSRIKSLKQYEVISLLHQYYINLTQLLSPIYHIVAEWTRHYGDGNHHRSPTIAILCLGHWSMKCRSRTQTTMWHQQIMSRWTVGVSLVNVAPIGAVI